MDNLDVGINFEYIYEHYEKETGIVLEGGSRSGKTWGISHFLCWYMENFSGKVITIGRDKLTHLKKTLLIDFKQALYAFGIPDTIHKTEMVMEYNGNILRFVGLNDDIMLSHGLTQNVFWCNEVMSIGKDTFDQIKQRTSDFWILDYNPSASIHWVYDLELRDDVRFFKTTVLDNPFAPPNVTKEILAYEPWKPGIYKVRGNDILYKGELISDRNQPPPHPINAIQGTADPFKWAVYGLGIRMDDVAMIYKQWEYFDRRPKGWDYRFIGLDFGFSADPTAVVECIIHGNNLYLSELLYQTSLTNPEIAKAIRKYCDGATYVVCDSAEPKSIRELRLNQIDAIAAVKGPDSVRSGINKVRSYKIHVNKKSLNLQNELQNYKWKKDERTGQVLDIPVGDFNHLLDAARYAVTKFYQ